MTSRTAVTIDIRNRATAKITNGVVLVFTLLTGVVVVMGALVVLVSVERQATIGEMVVG